MAKKPIHIDCDPGVDDAIAIFLACCAGEAFDLRAVSTVAGNVPLELTARNARIVREIAGVTDIPIHAGCPKPMIRPLVTAEDFHGSTGLMGIELFEPQLALSDSHAVDAIIRSVCEHSDAISLVITGPMTNVGAAIVQSPEIADRLERIIVMGGADKEGGNITPHAEYNVYADPHAAEIVFNCGAEIVVLNLDVTHQLRMTEDRVANVRSVGTKIAGHVASLMEATNILEKKANDWDAGPLHDPATILYLLRPDLFAGRRTHVSVDMTEGETLGQTRVTDDPDGNVLWIDRADVDGVFALMCTVLENAK
ncbi:MAG: nucleoside hydrolase [Pseudomonadota bacterium]